MRAMRINMSLHLRRLSWAIVGLACAAVLLPAIPAQDALAQEVRAFRGALVFRDGRRVTYEYLGSTGWGPMNLQLRGRMGEQQVTYRFAELRTITLIWDQRGLMGLELLAPNGKSVMITSPEISVGDADGFKTASGRSLPYLWLDDLTGGRKDERAEISKLAGIEIGADQGRFRRNQATGQIWPPYYVYDPYDGSVLGWSDEPAAPGAAQAVAARACPRCYAYCKPGQATCATCGVPSLLARLNLAERGLDFFLARAGIDPGSDAAQAAKRYSKAWLNPFSTEEESAAALAEVLKVAGAR